MLLSTLVMMLMKDTGPSEIPGQQAGVNKDTSEWPEARTLVTLNTMPGFHTCKQAGVNKDTSEWPEARTLVTL